MVSVYVKAGHVQRADDKVQVIVGQVTTGEHQINVNKTLAGAGAIDNGHNLIAYAENLHSCLLVSVGWQPSGPLLDGQTVGDGKIGFAESDVG